MSESACVTKVFGSVSSRRASSPTRSPADFLRTRIKAIIGDGQSGVLQRGTLEGPKDGRLPKLLRHVWNTRQPLHVPSPSWLSR